MRIKSIRKQAHKRKIVKVIMEYSQANGYPPSYRDIAITVYISIPYVQYLLDELIASGYVSRVNSKSRTLKVLNSDF